MQIIVVRRDALMNKHRNNTYEIELQRPQGIGFAQFCDA